MGVTTSRENVGSPDPKPPVAFKVTTISLQTRFPEGWVFGGQMSAQLLNISITQYCNQLTSRFIIHIQNSVGVIMIKPG